MVERSGMSLGKGDPMYKIRMTIDPVEVLNSGIPFTDTQFPGNPQSADKEGKEYTNIEWKRAGEIYTSGYAFLEFISPSEIQQGKLGNCYFLSALSALAEFPERVKRIFNGVAAGSGCYIVNLCLNGEYESIVVDDWFPCSEGLNENYVPFFSRSANPDLWVMIAEKAWAKVSGSYKNTTFGYTSEAFRALTGAPFDYLDHEDCPTREIWERISSADQKNYIICASAGNEDISCREFRDMGLVSNHSYALIQVKQLNAGGSKLRALQLRNPWGRMEYKGNLTNELTALSPANLKELGYIQGDHNKGAFWMEFQEYLDYFRSTTIAKVHDFYEFNSIGVGNNGGYSLVRINVKKGGKCPGFFTLSQKQERIMRESDRKYKIASSGMILGRVNEGGVEYMGGITSMKHENVTLEVAALTQGEYILLAEVNGNLDLGYCINSYTEHRVELELLPKGEDIQYRNFLPHVLKSCALIHTQPHKYDDKGEPHILRYNSLNDSKGGFGFYYYVNNSSKGGILIENVTFTKMENIKLLPPYSGNQFKIELHPGNDVIVLLKKTTNSASLSAKNVYGVKYPGGGMTGGGAARGGAGTRGRGVTGARGTTRGTTVRGTTTVRGATRGARGAAGGGGMMFQVAKGNQEAIIGNYGEMAPQEDPFSMGELYADLQPPPIQPPTYAGLAPRGRGRGGIPGTSRGRGAQSNIAANRGKPK